MQYSLEDYVAWAEVSFQWARALDTKDWDLLRSITASSLVIIDYSEVLDKKWENMSSQDFVALNSNPKMLGSPKIRTQHLLGAARVERLSEDTATAWRQIRAQHVLFEGDEPKQQPTMQSEGHGVVQHFYKRIDGLWKLHGLKAHGDFNSGGDFGALFKRLAEL